MTTVPRTVSGRHGGLRLTIKPAPTRTGTPGHALAKKMLHLIGITDCLLTIRGDEQEHENMAKALNNSLCELIYFKLYYLVFLMCCNNI